MVSTTEAWTILLAGSAIFCMGGIIFGVAALYPILMDENAFDASCAQASSVADCKAVVLASVTSYSLFAADGAMLAYGELGDRCGPRICFGTGAAISCLGLLMLALASYTRADALWYLAPLFIGVAGPGVFMGSLYLGEWFPSGRAIMSTVASKRLLCY